MNRIALTAEERAALVYAIDNLPQSRDVPCDDPQCGDSTWDHACSADHAAIPEAVSAVQELERLLARTVAPTRNPAT